MQHLLAFYLQSYLKWKHSDDHGDRPRPLPVIRELKKATVIHERTESPSWDFDVSDYRVVHYPFQILVYTLDAHFFSSQHVYKVITSKI